MGSNIVTFLYVVMLFLLFGATGLFWYAFTRDFNRVWVWSVVFVASIAAMLIAFLLEAQTGHYLLRLVQGFAGFHVGVATLMLLQEAKK